MLSRQLFSHSFSPQNISSSFKNTGIWPLYRLIFTDSDFKPNEILDRAMNAPSISDQTNNDKRLESTEKTLVKEVQQNYIKQRRDNCNRKSIGWTKYLQKKLVHVNL